MSLSGNLIAQSKNVNQMKKILTNNPANRVFGINYQLLINGEDQPNKALNKLLNEVPNPNELKNKKVAILVTDGVEEIELTFVRSILQ